ncbi:hypothetical protein Cgig2_029591 [Carnegiea gigantea]|uniref:RNase H type-1 domain-containing protein n=1 Tax=Carnegiea gigantea TaxID=171969 RepID=A0A9Q1JYS5_9CARY|nr:hypothetical protein Cgig2_029591 [Carnegiea gigantea]
MKPQNILEAFRDTLEGCDLHDLSYQGKDFTWRNGQSGCNSVEERLDRYCATSDWSALFLEARVSHINDDMSDHLLIMLRCFEEKNVQKEIERCTVQLKGTSDVHRWKGSWRMERGYDRCYFLAVDAELIKQIPLFTVWPRDRVMWHFSTSGVFTIRTAYHAIRCHCGEAVPMGSSSNHQVFWNKLWSLVVPPRIKMFLLRLCVHALPIKVALSKRVSILELKCEFCGAFQEDDVHALVEFPHTAQVWEWTGFKHSFWTNFYKSTQDLVERLLQDTKGTGFCGLEAEEANACLFAVKKALELDYEKVTVEGDCLSIIAKLRGKRFPNTSVGLILTEIIIGNRVAHTLAHLQPYNSGCRVWLGDDPDDILHLAVEDLHSDASE